MSLADYKGDMEMCSRCSACKFIPLELVRGSQLIDVCPSIAKYQFHAYSGGGRTNMELAMLDKRIDYSDKLLDIVYKCQMCGACDISCKYAMDMDVLEPMNEFRIKCVEDGHTSPALDKIISLLKKQDTMVPGVREKRGDWAASLKVKNYTKEKVDVIFHAGCQMSFNPEMQKLARTSVKLMQKARIDIGIGGENELCCGGRAYGMGYKDDFLNQAKKSMAQIKQSGAKTLVTGCAECYHAFKVLYDKFDLKGNLEVLHITEYLEKLLNEGKLKPTKNVNLTVTYHDPCHLGRLGEPYIHWQGTQIPGFQRRFDPPRVFRRGTYGIYEPPRNVLKSIPSLKLVEMDRIKEYAWCCGAGGGVTDSNPEFASWTANERISEAKATGATVLASACPWCEKVFNDAVKKSKSDIKIMDIIELLEMAI